MQTPTPIYSGLKYIIHKNTDKLQYYVPITDDIVDTVNNYIKNSLQPEWIFEREYDPVSDNAIQEARISFETKMNVTRVEGGGGRRPKSSKKRTARRSRSSKRKAHKARTTRA